MAHKSVNQSSKRKLPTPIAVFRASGQTGDMTTAEVRGMISNVEVGFASQKHFIGLYILRNDVMDAHRAFLKVKGVSLGKGCIRYSKPEKN